MHNFTRPTFRSFMLLVAALVISSCGRSPSTTTAAKSDEASQDVEYRLAALSPAIAVMLRDLGYEDRIVAKHDYDMVLGDRVPAAGSELGFDLEVLIQANPTHLFFQQTSADRSPKLLALAEEHGWVIFERPLNTLDDIASTMDDLYYYFKGAPQSQPDQLGFDFDFDIETNQDRTPPSMALAASWDDLGPVADAAGMVLVLGSVDPIGAMGPGSYHHQLIKRLGASPAIDEGSMWVELDYEDLIALNPDSIILIAPKQSSDDDRFGEPVSLTLQDAKAALGPIADLPISAVQNNRLGVIDHPLGLLPSGALGQVAEDMAEMMERWAQ